MASIRTAKFTNDLRGPSTVLPEQLRAAGVYKRGAADQISEADQTSLLKYLRKAQGTIEPENKTNPTRMQTREIKMGLSSTGKRQVTEKSSSPPQRPPDNKDLVIE